MGFSSPLNYDVVQTKLEAVWKQEFDMFVGPGVATVETPAIFRQTTSDKAEEHFEVFMGPGLWHEKGNQEDIKESQPRVANEIIFKNITWADSVSLDKEMFDKLCFRLCLA